MLFPFNGRSSFFLEKRLMDRFSDLFEQKVGRAKDLGKLWDMVANKTKVLARGGKLVPSLLGVPIAVVFLWPHQHGARRTGEEVNEKLLAIRVLKSFYSLSPQCWLPPFILHHFISGFFFLVTDLHSPITFRFYTPQLKSSLPLFWSHFCIFKLPEHILSVWITKICLIFPT